MIELTPVIAYDVVMDTKTITLDKEKLMNDTIAYWRGQVAERDAEIKRLRETLGIYADPNRWTVMNNLEHRFLYFGNPNEPASAALDKGEVK